MNKRLSAACLLLLGAGLFNVSVADDGARDTVLKSVQKLFPGITADSVSPSPMDGVSEVVIGPRLLYVSNDGKYLLQGSLIDLASKTDVSEERRGQIRIAALDKLGQDKMIIFPAKDEKHVITVFTDIDCGYCRKLHGDMKKYNAEGITVRYLSFPRGGLQSPSYAKAVTVWCSDDQQAALTDSKQGKDLPGKTCDNPVKEEYELGQMLGVRGTPAIITDTGAMLPGYVPPARLAAALDAGTS